MKKILLVFITLFITNFVNAEVKIGFVQVDKILKSAPQTSSSNKKLEKEFKKKNR
jgi:outer membrane protein